MREADEQEERWTAKQTAMVITVTRGWFTELNLPNCHTENSILSVKRQLYEITLDQWKTCSLKTFRSIFIDLKRTFPVIAF